MRAQDVISQPLLEMSLDRPAAIADLRGIARPLNLHLIYLYGYQAPEDTRLHWRNEVLSWLDDVATITVKPKDRRLTAKDYYKHLFDERFGPNMVRNITAMHRRIRRDKPDLGEPTITDQEIWNKMQAFHRAFAQRASTGQPYDDLVP